MSRRKAYGHQAGVSKVLAWRDELARVNVLSLHLPLSAETRNIIDAGILSELPANAVLVNTARGGLVDEAALYQALTTRMIDGAAALDTFCVDPAGIDNPSLSLPNVANPARTVRR